MCSKVGSEVDKFSVGRTLNKCHTQKTDEGDNQKASSPRPEEAFIKAQQSIDHQKLPHRNDHDGIKE